MSESSGMISHIHHCTEAINWCKNWFIIISPSTANYWMGYWPFIYS